MKKIILALLTLTIAGCHFTEGPVVVYEPVPTYAKTVVVYEEPYYCDKWGAAPFYDSPDFCYANEECDWYVGWGCYEVWQWDDWTCEWEYLYDYCV